MGGFVKGSQLMKNEKYRLSCHPSHLFLLPVNQAFDLKLKRWIQKGFDSLLKKCV